MIELDSVLVVILLEALGGLALLVVGFLLFSRIKSSGEQAAANELIDGLEDTKNIKNKKLQNIISEFCSIEEAELESYLSEITQSERLLYQQIIQIFLNKDSRLLQEIDSYVNDLSSPYIKLLSHTSSNSTESDTKQLKIAENKIQNLMDENKKVSDQLSIAMQTMDEISAEYTRVFSGMQTELELENSLKRMFEIFHTAEQQVKASCIDQDTMQL